MTERDESLHFSQANPEHMRKWFELAVKFAARESRRANG